ncbi:MAG: hypothetical protein IT378_16895 [Sandaracinaceae bacterium]|nr:hypothetical protein [Sandaracinaceae bacterium]
MRIALCVLVLSACSSAPASPDAGRIVDRDAVVPCAEPGSRRLGDPCRCNSECEASSPICLTEEVSGYPGGRCSPYCETSADCPSGEYCEYNTCFRSCASAADCAPSSICFDARCLPFCDEDSDCTATGRCNNYRGACVAPDATIEGGGLDAPCRSDLECRSGTCNTNGHCISPCHVDARLCPDDGVCLRGRGELGVCFPPCESGGTCGDPARRCTTYLSDDNRSACVEPTADGCLGRLGTLTDGLPCGCDLDCAEGSRCITEARSGMPAGICQRSCSTDQDCQSGARCMGGTCLAGCARPSDCPAGRICWGYSGVCYPACDEDSDCLGGACDEYRNRCGAETTGAGLGAPCGANEECRSRACLSGTCSTLCSVSGPACPEAVTCAPFAPGDDFGTCTP